jgi:cobalt-zinc-cadmium resistance protein CzcA
VFTARNEGMRYLSVKIDRLAAGRRGLHVDELEQMLKAQIEGEKLGIVQEGNQRTPLLLRGAGELENFSVLQIALPDGQHIPLSALALVEHVEGVVSVARERGQRFAVVRSNVAGRDLVGFVEEARQVIQREVSLPAGYSLEWGGQFENQQRASARLTLVIPVSLALIGGIFALWISGEYLSVPASVGFIALLGIAVLNGVVMLSHFNQLRALGMDLDQVVKLGSLRRLRPVLMTASITAFGLIPLLFATGPGSEIQRPLAVVVIGGLLSSTLLTLILLPMLYRRYA